jgi:nucleotide-binding universal stress UspA family protein
VNRKDDIMEQAGPEPQPGKPDRAAQPGQEARLARDSHDVPAAREPAPRPSRANESAAAACLRQLVHPVIVGYDGSCSSRNALAYAAGFARRLGRPLLVVYVAPFGVYCEPMTGQVVYPVRERAEVEPWLLGELDQACDWQGLDVSIMTRRGNAARELAAAADSISADALIVGAPGHWLHHVAGSIPGWLARHARCPVIVVP